MRVRAELPRKDDATIDAVQNWWLGPFKYYVRKILAFLDPLCTQGIHSNKDPLPPYGIRKISSDIMMQEHM